MKKNVTKKWELVKSDEIKSRFISLCLELGRSEIKPEQVMCMISTSSKARAYARIWGLPRIFQEAFGIPALYVLEILSEYFEKLSYEEQTKVLIHESMHIPKSFSGALLPHNAHHQKIDKKTVDKIMKAYLEKRGE